MAVSFQRNPHGHNGKCLRGKQSLGSLPPSFAWVLFANEIMIDASTVGIWKRWIVSYLYRILYERCLPQNAIKEDSFCTLHIVCWNPKPPCMWTLTFRFVPIRHALLYVYDVSPKSVRDGRSRRLKISGDVMMGVKGMEWMEYGWHGGWIHTKICSWTSRHETKFSRSFSGHEGVWLQRTTTYSTNSFQQRDRLFVFDGLALDTMVLQDNFSSTLDPTENTVHDILIHKKSEENKKISTPDTILENKKK